MRFIRWTLFIFGMMGLCIGLLRTVHVGSADVTLVAGVDFERKQAYIRVSSNSVDLHYINARDVYGWSDDGRWLVTAIKRGQEVGVYAMNPAGVIVHPLTPEENNTIAYEFNNWSPDRNWVFTRVQYKSLEPYSGNMARLEDGNIVPVGNVLGTIVWSADREWVVFGDGIYSTSINFLYLMHTDAEAPQLLFNTDGLVVMPQFSPDNQFVYFIHKSDNSFFTQRIRLDGSDLTNVGCEPDRAFHTQAFMISPNGDWVVCTTWNPQTERHYLYVTHMNGDQPVLLAENIEDFRTSMMFSPDGAWLSYAIREPGGSSTLHLARPDGSQQILLSESYDPYGTDAISGNAPVVYDSTGRYMLFLATGPRGIYRVDMVDQTISTLTYDIYLEGGNGVWLAPDRESVWTLVRDPTLPAFTNVRIADGIETVFPLRKQTDPYFKPRDLRAVMFIGIDGQLYLLDMNTTQTRRLLEIPPDVELQNVKWSPDETWVTFVLHDPNQKTVEVAALNLISGELLTFQPDRYAPNLVPFWTNDSAGIYFSYLDESASRTAHFMFDLNDNSLRELARVPHNLAEKDPELVSPVPLPAMTPPWILLLVSGGMVFAGVVSSWRT